MFLFFHRFHSDETESAVENGEKVRLFSGKPTGRSTWGARGFGGRGGPRVRWEKKS